MRQQKQKRVQTVASTSSFFLGARLKKQTNKTRYKKTKKGKCVPSPSVSFHILLSLFTKAAVGENGVKGVEVPGAGGGERADSR